MRAIGINVLHKQAHIVATTSIQDLRNEEQFLADFAKGVVWKAGDTPRR